MMSDVLSHAIEETEHGQLPDPASAAAKALAVMKALQCVLDPPHAPGLNKPWPTWTCRPLWTTRAGRRSATPWEASHEDRGQDHRAVRRRWTRRFHGDQAGQVAGAVERAFRHEIDRLSSPKLPANEWTALNAGHGPSRNSSEGLTGNKRPRTPSTRTTHGSKLRLRAADGRRR
jgi:hypothetical protein